jgi:hypothetical protein
MRYSRFLIAGGDIVAFPKFARPFRGKIAKECYRCAKGVVVTRSISGPAAFAIAKIPAEMSKGFIYSAFAQVGETVIGYACGIGFVRWIYKATAVTYVKGIARTIYNIGSLPVTLYCRGIDEAFDFVRIGKVEKWWFGEPVYIFNDKRIWIEANFTLDGALKAAAGEE